MKKYWFGIFVGLFLAGCLFSISATAQSTDRRTQLEEKKLELEIRHLEEEARSNSLTSWSTIIGSLIGAATIIWTIYSGIRTMKQQIEQRRNERISSLMEKLSAESLSLRLGAVRGLSRYADDALPELLATASNENSVAVRGALEDTLTTIEAVNFDQIVSANSRSIPKRIHLLGRFSQLESEPEGAIFGFFTEEVQKLIVQGFQVEFEHGQRLQTQRQKIPDLGKRELDELHQIRQNLLRTAQITTGVLSRWIRARRNFVWPDAGLDLVKANLFRGTLDNVRSQYVLLTFSILRFSQFRNCEITDSDFSQSEMNESSFDKCEFYRCYFRETNLCNIIAHGCVFSECCFIGANFSEAELQHADFTNSDARQSKFIGAQLDSADFSNSILQDTKFNAANLSRASFENADLRNADFSGAILTQTNFVGANVTGARFYNCNDFGTASFDVVPPQATD
jgi:uncharacterized protein YjbI with pentapeptide repeats